jgi:hypothetical protein
MHGLATRPTTLASRHLTTATRPMTTSLGDVLLLSLPTALE